MPGLPGLPPGHVSRTGTGLQSGTNPSQPLHTTSTSSQHCHHSAKHRVAPLYVCCDPSPHHFISRSAARTPTPASPAVVLWPRLTTAHPTTAGVVRRGHSTTKSKSKPKVKIKGQSQNQGQGQGQEPPALRAARRGTASRQHSKNSTPATSTTTQRHSTKQHKPVNAVGR